MKDEVPFAVRMDVEGAVQIVDHRAAELAVDGRDGPAHLCSSSPICRVIYDKVQQLERIRKSKLGDFLSPSRLTVQYFLHSGFVRLGGPILANTSLG